jgi:hypothetical protein
MHSIEAALLAAREQELLPLMNIGYGVHFGLRGTKDRMLKETSEKL